MARVTSHESRVTRITLPATITAGVAVILILIPFHAFLTVYAASFVGHYTAVRLWKEVLLVPLVAVACWLLAKKPAVRRTIFGSTLFRLMIAYVCVQILLGLAAYARHDVNRAALGEGLIEDTRLMVIFFVAWVAASCSPWLRGHWQKLVLVPAAVVIIFGILQITALPANFLSHFGYSASTIKPYELVDQNPNFYRVQSTLRGANPLGAYLILPITLIGTLLIGPKFRRQIPKDSVWWFVVVGLASLAVLYFTYSRSAVLGTALAVFLAAWLMFKSASLKRNLLIAIAAVCIILGGFVVALRHNAAVENTFFHTSQQSRSKQSSNQDRSAGLKQGFHDVTHNPFGDGAGSAGPASVHNNHPAKIAENYYLQIGQEAGWLGLALFLSINILIAKELWKRRDEADALPVVLLASLAGISFVNMLSHAWADDTLAYLWWGLAGVACVKIHGPMATKGRHKKVRD